MTRVLIADGQLSVCRRLRQMLERRHDIEVIGEVSGASSVSKVIKQLQPDILLIDLGLCQQPALLDLDVGGPSPRRAIVMLATVDKGSIVEAFRFGAQGILPKTVGPTMWWRTIRRVMDGQFCFENGSVAVLLEAFRASFSQPSGFAQKQYGLTTRELEILAEIAAGRSNREVGQRFSICERTVKHHLTSIFDKVGVSSRLELALFAVKHRLVSVESIDRQPTGEANAAAGGQRSAVAAAGI